jgi:serine phosphatase RsbU (regulator of sigma subunit)
MPNPPGRSPSEPGNTDALHTVYVPGARRAPIAAPFLTVVQGLTRARSLPITQEPLILGRDVSREFHLSDNEVSRSHCEVRLATQGVVVRDLGSTNGTFVDGTRIAGETLLRNGALLQLGNHVLRCESLTPKEVQQQEQLTSDLDRARRYLLALIPEPIATGPIRVEWAFEPSSVLGGDAMGYHTLADGRLALYVIDVCGHGIGPAMHSASVVNVLRGNGLLGDESSEPAQVLQRLNAAFGMDSHSGMYFTIWYGVLDPKTRRLTYSSAGHPPALVRAADGSIRAQLACRHPPIGVMDELAFTQTDAALVAGERLYVFSDGVYEMLASDGRELGLRDFERALVDMPAAAAPGEAKLILDRARATNGGPGFDDDFTLLLLSCPTSPSSR